MSSLFQDLAYRTEQVYGLAAVMFEAAQAEDNTVHEMSEKMSRLEYENKRLREVLQLSCPVISDNVPGDRTLNSD